MATESLVLGGVQLNDETNYVLEAVDFTPPAKKPEWAQAADADGANLVRPPLFENRTITVSARVAPQATMDLALAKVGALVDLLQEAEKNPGGTSLEWTPAGATKTITFGVLTGAVTKLPTEWPGGETGWYSKQPVVSLTLTCKPFGYGAEVTGSLVKNEGQPNLTIVIPTVAGDVPAEGKLVITDTGGAGYRYVEWGLQNRYYDAATKLLIDSEDLIPVGGAQSTTLATAGAYKRAGATKATIATTLLAEPTICCNTGVLPHVGVFRVKARVWYRWGGGQTENVKLRMSWQDGEGPLRANAWQSPNLRNIFVEVDLGVITITPAVTGGQKWFGQIEAYSTNTTATLDILDVDMLTLVPVAEGYGKARGVQTSSPGTITAFDNFTTGTLSGVLNARTPAIGSAWATSGATTDWTVETGKVKRATISDAGPRYGVFGTALTGMRTVAKGTLSVGGKPYIGVLARWVDANNYAAVRCERAEGIRMVLEVKVAGVSTVLAEVNPPFSGANAFEMRAELTALPDGSLAASISGTFKTTFAASHASIATGGALASGKAGVIDQATNAEASSRTFTAVNGYSLPNIPYCIQPGRLMQIRSDSAIEVDNTGAYYGNVPLYRGSRFYIPQSGSAKRETRILVKADRNDLETSDQGEVGQAVTAQASWLPRFHVIPR